MLKPIPEPWARRALRWAVAAAGAAVLAACGGGGSGSAERTSEAASAPVSYLASLSQPPAQDALRLQIKEYSQGAEARPVARPITLAALSSERADAGAAPQDASQPLKIGYGRAVAPAESAESTAALLDWSTAADGWRVAALSVRSPEARGLRLGVQVGQLPPGTVLRVYAVGGSETVEVDSREVLRTIQTNLDAGIADADARTYWLPTVAGDEVVLEFRLPADVDPALLRVALPQVSHMVALATDRDELRQVSGSCNIDVMCTTGHDDASRAVARTVFASGGSSYLCTGTLLNNTQQDGTPYFLTANHCISTQAQASSVETYWNYRSTACNSDQLTPNYSRVTGGAQLLWNSTSTDTSFMRLNGTPPTTAVFAGWDSRAPSVASSVFGIHHPRGDLQKYSEGTLNVFYNCDSSTSGSFTCTLGNSSTSAFLNTLFTRGTTEAGSSGSALFSAAGLVIGQLRGGSSSCTVLNGSNVYGRFDLAYALGLSKWLSPSVAATPSIVKTAVYRFYNTLTSAHFYTTNTLERDYLIANDKAWSYEGPTYYAATAAATGLAPVYRFYNTESRVHFYTIDAAERDNILATMRAFAYEGTAWYAQTAAGGTASPVYRFYSAARRAHFYTISAAEADYVRRSVTDFAAEGTAFYAWTTP